MGLFTRKKTDPNDPALDDAQWLRAGEARYDKAVSSYYGSPETLAKGGFERLTDPASALYFFQKAIDLLQTNYGYLEMSRRRPSDNDLAIIDGYLEALATATQLRPGAPIEGSVREVTHRLRSISTECKSQGLDPRLYLVALDRLHSVAPHVNVDDIYWS